MAGMDIKVYCKSIKASVILPEPLRICYVGIGFAVDTHPLARRVDKTSIEGSLLIVVVYL